MASPTHPNQFAIEQQVLFRTANGHRWRDGVIHAASIDDPRRERRSPDGLSKSGHDGGCDGYLYTIDDPRFDRFLREEQKKARLVTCMCDTRIVDADSTGRWMGMRLTSPEELALLLLDTTRRGAHVATDAAVDEDDLDNLDVVRFLEMPGYHHLASARTDDLVAWASGIPAAEWKVPVE